MLQYLYYTQVSEVENCRIALFDCHFVAAMENSFFLITNWKE
jgi:hypothetical protein